MKLVPLLQRLGLIFVLTLAAIVLHECGHYVVYRAAGYSARISLQSVRPVGNVNPQLDLAAKAAGPAVSLIAGLLLLAAAKRKPSFLWTTAAFTNASLRIFPGIMDFLRAIRSSKPFSDEGQVVLAFVSGAAGRASLMLCVIALFSAVSIQVARRFPFSNYRAFKVLSVYVLSVAVGIAVVIMDELLGLNR